MGRGQGSRGGLNHPLQIVVRRSNKLLVYRDVQSGACAQKAKANKRCNCASKPDTNGKGSRHYRGSRRISLKYAIRLCSVADTTLDLPIAKWGVDLDTLVVKQHFSLLPRNTSYISPVQHVGVVPSVGHAHTFDRPLRDAVDYHWLRQARRLSSRL